jgi:hypothetical protein
VATKESCAATVEWDVIASIVSPSVSEYYLIGSLFSEIYSITVFITWQVGTVSGLAKQTAEL